MTQSISAVGSVVIHEDFDETVAVVGLRAGGCENTGFVSVSRPSLQWRLDSKRPGAAQAAYQIAIATGPQFDETIFIQDLQESTFPTAPTWPAAPLDSRTECWVRLRVKTDRGLTGWSEALRIEAALLCDDDWTARPISPLSNRDRSEPAPVPLLRKRFRIDKPVARARLYVSALGVHDTWINGTPLSNDKLEPGWTAYKERLLYAAHDVTDRIVEGENVLCGAVGDGWWRGWLTWMERRGCYGTTTAYLAQLEITFVDGSIDIIGTDETWRGSTGAILAADLYDGTTIDARAGNGEWLRSGFDDANWESVCMLALPAGLELRSMPPVRIVQRWSAIPRPVGHGRWIVDAGQNLAGYLRIGVRGAADAMITVRHAELLDDHGQLHTAPLRNAKAIDRYVLADGEQTSLEPAFTFHGFRFAEIVASDGVVIESVEVCALSTDMQQIGTFACSDERINKLYQNVRWSQIGNFVALPTDCPQRDERLGWTGDIQVFSDTACMNAEAGPFLASWLRDLEIEQRADGNVPSTVPNVIGGHEFEYGGVGWGDAATLVPWAVYTATGDLGVLHAQFDSMCRWVDYGASRRGDDGTWSRDFQLGDWLDPGAPADQPEKATTDSNFIATAYLSRSAAVVARTADLIGRNDLVRRYEALAQDAARAAWQRWKDHLVTTQAGCAIALQFGIVPIDCIDQVGLTLAALVEANEGRIATGFLGTPLVLPALSATGQVEAAYRLLLNDDCPGWLYQVKHGATTMWERWDAVQEDGSLHAGEISSGEGSSMISYNHYAYGAVALWLYQTVAGVAADVLDPGYRRVLFAPKPGGGISWARGSIDTPFGSSGIAWSIGKAGALDVDMHIAPGATGLFEVPAGWSLLDNNGIALASIELGAGRHKVSLACV